jgi:hypothetical protein
MNNESKKRIAFAIFIMGILISTEYVHSAAWWGDGARRPEWIVARGGSIFNYTVTGTSHPEDYKAMMFRDGEYVEVEFGEDATFDDAKNGTYVINFYKCKDSCMPHKFDNKTKIRSSDKKVATITVVARPGETNNLIFDADNKTVFFASRSGFVAPVDPFVAQKKEAQEKEGEKYVYTTAQAKSLRLRQFHYLAESVNNAQYRDRNIAVGIVPQFNVHK